MDERVYIGSAKDFKDRKRRHIKSLIDLNHHSIKLQRFVNKYGIDKIIFEVVELCSPETLLIKEQYWIDFYNSSKVGFNILKTAGSWLGHRHTLESIKKQSDFRKGKVTVAMLGKKHKESSKELMRQKALNRKQSSETIAKRIAKNTGKKRSESAKNATTMKIKKLSDIDILEIKKLLSNGIFQTVIANMFGVCQRNISRIKQGISYKHLL